MKNILSFILPVLLVLDTAMICILYNSGIIWPGSLMQKEYPVLSVDISDYPVHGVDVSEYQGNIDWNVLAGQDISFAYIKATKGNGYQDKKFIFNWINANKTALKVGAYHLFSYEDSASAQADNFTGIVPKQKGSLPPAVDIELYGEQKKDPPDKEKTIRILTELLQKLEDYYDKKPVIYVTKKSFDLYINGNFNEYPIWVRNVKTIPMLSDNREWTFWQFSNRGVLKGYEGEETFIDLNVFNGTKEEFKNLFQ